MKKISLVSASAMTLCILASAVSEASTDFSGRWEGTLSLDGRVVPLKAEFLARDAQCVGHVVYRLQSRLLNELGGAVVSEDKLGIFFAEEERGGRFAALITPAGATPGTLLGAIHRVPSTCLENRADQGFTCIQREGEKVGQLALLRAADAKHELIQGVLHMPKGRPFSSDTFKRETTEWDLSIAIFKDSWLGVIASRQTASGEVEFRGTQGRYIEHRRWFTVVQGPPVFDLEGNVVAPATLLEGILAPPESWGSVKAQTHGPRDADGELLGTFKLTLF